eukprot:TRINITY_DN13166_c0_g1_i1.p1 TRINITY_DN13166_c0_g1~~TRINITY_DN13166_c0_g1_i1.p1  ORF type:complete len:285 (+),score=49.12 TRINITY_DN13166_c0_g1_i1:22-876(+)
MKEENVKVVIGSIATVIATQPLDTIKTRFQLGHYKKEKLNWKIEEYGNIRKSLSHLFKAEGIKGLYRGVTPSIIEIVAITGARTVFWSYIIAKHCPSILDYFNVAKIEKKNNELKLINVDKYIMMGAITGSLESFFVTLFDNMKIKFQVQPIENNLYRELFKGNLFRGYVITMLRQIMYCSCVFTSFQYFQLKLVDEDNELYGTNKLLCGLSSGSLSTLLISPIDKKKTSIQADIDKKNNNIKLTMKRIYKECGLFGFYRGSLTHLIKNSIGITLFLMIVENSF